MTVLAANRDVAARVSLEARDMIRFGFDSGHPGEDAVGAVWMKSGGTMDVELNWVAGRVCGGDWEAGESTVTELLEVLETK